MSGKFRISGQIIKRHAILIDLMALKIKCLQKAFFSVKKGVII